MVDVTEAAFSVYHMCGGFSQESADTCADFKELLAKNLYQRDPIWYRKKSINLNSLISG